jgi:hypothetical protein
LPRGHKPRGFFLAAFDAGMMLKHLWRIFVPATMAVEGSALREWSGRGNIARCASEAPDSAL